jgi:SAM-dependent methyltransferase
MNKSKVDFDNYIENYNSLLQENTRFFSDNETYFARYKVDILRRAVPGSAKRLLEYGCGIGRNIPFLRAAFPNATIAGSDISAPSLEFARKENPGIDFFVEDDNSVASETYNVIFIAGVFHHIPSEQRLPIMKNLYSRLSIGGSIVIFEHNPYNPVTRKLVNDCPYDSDAVLLKPKELKSLLTSAGLTLSGGAYCLFVPPSLPALLHLETKLGWLPLGGQYWVMAKRTA